MKLLKVEKLEAVFEKLNSNRNSERQFEKVFISNAVGRYHAEDVHAKNNLPEFNKSVVDGYAVIGNDTFGASESMPSFLDIVGTVNIGKTYNIEIKEGEAIYVPTGGIIPKGANAMVMIEYIEKLDENTIAVYKPSAPGAGIMFVGDDYKQDDFLFSKGHRIKRKDVGVLASQGIEEVLVYKKIEVSIISTGDEIVNIFETPKLGQIRDINSYTLGTMVEEIGGSVNCRITLKDEYDEIKETVENRLEESDLVILSGGSSAGEHDMTVDILNDIGEPGVLAHGLAIKPGKPTIVAKINEKVIFGLPGHPVSAIVVFKVLVEKYIKEIFYNNHEEEHTIIAELSENIKSAEGKETYQMIKLVKKENGYIAQPIYAKSGAISLLMNADGYIKTSIRSEGLIKNETVNVYLLK